MMINVVIIFNDKRNRNLEKAYKQVYGVWK